MDIKYEKTKTGCYECISHKANKSGYPCKKYKGQKTPVYRIVFEQYFGEIPKGFCVIHSCNNNRCINPHHLEISKQVKITKGESNGRSRFTENQIRYILTSNKSNAELGRELNAARSVISSIRTGKTWSHLDIKYNGHKGNRFGEDIKTSKLTETQVLDIISMLDIHKIKYVAEYFNVSKSLVSKIKNNKLWKHLPRPH